MRIEDLLVLIAAFALVIFVLKTVFEHKINQIGHQILNLVLDFEARICRFLTCKKKS